MDWGLLADPSAYPQYVAAGLMFGLAGWLLRHDVHKRAMRAFALFLGLRASAMLISVFGAVTLTDPSLASIWWRFSPFFVIATPFAVLYFVSLYPTPRGWFARPPHGPVTLILAGGLFEYVFLFRPDLLAVLAVNAAGTLHVVRYGPLILFAGLLSIAYAFASVALAREYTRMEAGPARSSVLVVCAAFALNALYDSAGEIFRTSPNAAVTAGEWISLNSLLVEAAWIPVLVAVAILVRHVLRTEAPAARSATLRFAAVLPLPVLSNALLSLFLTGPAWQNPWAIVLMGAWRLSLPLLVVYALVRHRLFDLDVKVKWAVKQSTVAAVFAGVFFVVSEGAELLVQSRWGQLVGLAAAGLLTLALAPLQRLGEDLADRTLPNAEDPDDLEGDRRLRFYREQVEIAIMDEQVTPKERKLLDNLAEELDLGPKEIRSIEREVGLPDVVQADSSPAAP